MAAAGTVAVLLPGAFYMLRETQEPPVEAFRRHGVADGGRDRLQSRHLAARDLAAAAPEHGRDVVPPDGGGGLAGVTREAARRSGARTRSARSSRQVVRPRDLGRRASGRARRLHRLQPAARARVEGSVRASGGISPPPCGEGQGWGSRGRTSAFRGCARPPIQSTLVPRAAFIAPTPTRLGLRPSPASPQGGGKTRRSPGILLRPGAMALADWRAIYRGAAVALDTAAAPRSRPGRRRSTRSSRGEPVYGINTGFGKLASVRIPDGDLAQLQRNIVLSHAAGVGEPLPAPVVRLMMALEARQPRRRAPRACAGDADASARRCSSAGSSRSCRPRLGRRLGRPRAARAHGRGDDRRRRGRSSTARGCRPREALGRAGLAPLELGPKEGPGAAQRHAGLDRLRARRPVRGRARVRSARSSPARSSTDAARGSRRAVRRRASTRCAATAARSRSRAALRDADGRQRHPRLAPRRRRPRAGSLLPALPAAGDGRRARPAAPGRSDARDRGQRRLRQSAGLRRRRRGRSRAAISTPSRSPSPPT